MFSIPSHEFDAAREQVDQSSRYGGYGNTHARHRPVSPVLAARLSIGDKNDRNDWPEYRGDYFDHPQQRKHADPRIHFSVRKSDTDRRFVKALGDQIAIYSLIVSIIVLGIFAVIGAAALVEHDRQIAMAERV